MAEAIVRDVELRAGDADRERVAGRLRRAHADGRIDLFEYDERLARAYAARTYLDLEPLTVDLPAEPRRPASVGRRAARYRFALRIEVAAWLVAGLVNLGIWAVVSLAGAHAVYPWWVWVVGPWGLVLLARVLEDRHRDGRRCRASTRF